MEVKTILHDKRLFKPDNAKSLMRIPVEFFCFRCFCCRTLIVTGPSAQHTDARNSVSLSYPHLIQLIGNYGVFWVYTAVSALGLLFCIMFVPETRHRTLEEIESHFR